MADIGSRYWVAGVDRPVGEDDEVDRVRTTDPIDASDARGAHPDGDGARPPHRFARSVEYRAGVDTVYGAGVIDRAYEKIREIERDTVTPAMRRVEAEDPDRHLAGLENRLKGRDRLTEKVQFDVRKKGRTVDQAISNVKDAIRYTFCYNEDSYTKGVHADCHRLAAEGFELVERRNSWDKDQYKGINSRWRVPSAGQLFEVQFHTQTSLEAKEETHWAYEKLRTGVPTAAEQRELEEFQTRTTASVAIPPGSRDIPDYP
jgi:hypothetical protein